MVVAVLAEAVLLALIGGLVGGGLAWLVANGYETATINWQTFSQVAFRLAVTRGLLVSGIVYAVIMGLIGGILPAIRVARMPVAIALRRV